MGADVYSGNPAELVTPSQTTGGASGRTYTINSNLTWIALSTLLINWTATATAGTRIMTALFADPQGNVIYRMNVATGITAVTFRISFGAGLPSAFLVANILLLPLPEPLLLPPGATVQIFDAANIDPADTIQAAAVYTQ